MSLRRHLTRDGIAHANADSATHKRHVSQRAARRTIEWVPAIAEPNAAAEFRLQADELEIANGVYYVGHGNDERAVCGTEFEASCAAVNWQRSWNTAEMQRRVKVAADTPGSKDAILLRRAPFVGKDNTQLAKSSSSILRRGRVLGWAMSPILDAPLTIAARRMALAQRSAAPRPHRPLRSWPSVRQRSVSPAPGSPRPARFHEPQRRLHRNLL